ncbi:MAG TPA: DUF3592 domain-containing protein [Herpetosiphonaceae bacterium]
MPLDQLIPGIIGLLIFGIPTAYLIWLWLLALQSRSWATTPGTITRSQVQPGVRQQATASIHYTYLVDGKEYTGTTVYFGGFINARASDARETVRRYSRGATVTVRYHPQRPGTSTLETRVSRGLLLWIVLGLGMASSILYGLITGT